MNKNLFKTVTELTGLPVDLVQNDLRLYLKRMEISEEDLTIEDLRLVMSAYLSETIEKTLDLS